MNAYIQISVYSSFLRSLANQFNSLISSLRNPLYTKQTPTFLVGVDTRKLFWALETKGLFLSSRSAAVTESAPKHKAHKTLTHIRSRRLLCTFLSWAKWDKVKRRRKTGVNAFVLWYLFLCKIKVVNFMPVLWYEFFFAFAFATFNQTRTMVYSAIQAELLEISLLYSV